MADGGFFDVPRTTVATTQGNVELPIFYYDVSVRQLNFFVDYSSALSRLEGTGLVPCRVFNGKAVACLVFYNYRDTSIGPYEEVAMVILSYPESFKDPRLYLANMVRRNGHKWTVGAYVLELPVTIPEARVAGREIWGYPKYLTDIPFTQELRVHRAGWAGRPACHDGRMRAGPRDQHDRDRPGDVHRSR
jgi:hypothetical protein